MPLNIPKHLPAIELLKKENIFVMDDLRAREQDIRPLRMLVLNLMPLKIETETDLIRLLSNTPLQIEMQLLTMASHIPKNTPAEHMRGFYTTFDKVKHNRYDGLIVTGAPVEMMPFEEVGYWNELTQVMDWAREHVTSTFYICWGAQAALYHFYGVKKHVMDKKLFGVFEHQLTKPLNKLFRGFDDRFYVPHSRHTTILKEEVEQVKELTILSESDKAGVYIVMSRNGREFYVTGHSEYAPLTLHNEYVRDMKKGLDSVDMPVNYYPGDDAQQEPIVRWRGHANLLFVNWLNYFVYQETPYEL